MINVNITVDDELYELSLPTSWEEVTVEQFAKVNAIPQDKPQLEYTIETLSALLGLDMDVVLMLPAEDFNEMVQSIDFLKEKIEEPEIESIIVDGVEYYLKKDFSKLTMGESISLEVLIEKSNGNIMSKLPELLCIFLRQKKENGKLEAFKADFMQRVESFKKINVVDVNRLFVFFSNGEG